MLVRRVYRVNIVTAWPPRVEHVYVIQHKGSTKLTLIYSSNGCENRFYIQPHSKGGLYLVCILSWLTLPPFC